MKEGMFFKTDFTAEGTPLNNVWQARKKWSHSVMSSFLQTHGLKPTRHLHPWNFPWASLSFSSLRKKRIDIFVDNAIRWTKFLSITSVFSTNGCWIFPLSFPNIFFFFCFSDYIGKTLNVFIIFFESLLTEFSFLLVILAHHKLKKSGSWNQDALETVPWWAQDMQSCT